MLTDRQGVNAALSSALCSVSTYFYLLLCLLKVACHLGPFITLIQFLYKSAVQKQGATWVLHFSTAFVKMLNHFNGEVDHLYGFLYNAGGLQKS